jgi:hypothetical protein
MRHLWVLAFIVGSVGHANATATSSTVGPAPSCVPGAYPGRDNYHVGQSANGAAIGLMWCTDDTGINYWAVDLDLEAKTVPACLHDPDGGTQQQIVTHAWNACVTGGFTADQQQELKVLLAQWMPRLQVAGPADATVYIYDANCTSTTITSCASTAYVVAGERQTLAPGQRCATTGGLDADSHLPYFSVAGLTSQQGVKLPAGTYAYCITEYPPTEGWPAS